VVHRFLRSVSAIVGAAGLSAGLASTASADPGQAHASLTARVLINGAKLHHNVKGKAEALADPDDIVKVGGRLFVAWQNGVGSKGEPSSTGNTASTLIEATVSGRVVRQWDLTGKIDGLGANHVTGEVVATVNEDGNSSLYTINPHAPRGKGVKHYVYNKNPLPSGGGTDAVTFQDGLMLVSASAPTVATGPAVYEVTLEPTGTAVVKSLFADNAAARPANPGAPTKLALTDPDSNIAVPRSAPRFGGDFMLDSQGDKQQIYVSHPGTPAQTLSVLALSQSVDDTAFVTDDQGALVSSDPTSNTVDAITGALHPGQTFVAVTPCDANGAPSTCPGPGFPANHLGALSLRTGTVSPVTVAGVTFNPQSLLYVGGAGQGAQGTQGN